MVVWNFDERSVTWSVLDLEDLSDGHVTALLDSFSIKVAATSSARLGSAASIAALINGNELSPASNSCWLRCKTLGPKGVALAVPNAGAITRDGTLLVWPPLDELATFALRHLQTGRSDTAVLFWLNADGWGDPGREKDVLAHPLEVADSVAKFLVQLEQSQPDLSSFYSRIGVFFDIEPVPTTLVNAYRTLLQATRNALLRNGLNEVKLAVFPTKRTATGDTDLWSDSDFLTIGSDVDLFLYGAYDYGTLLSAQIYSSKVATDLTALANIGLGPKLVPLVSTGNVTISHSGWETVGAGVDGIQASTAAQQLRGLGLFQLWGGQPGGKPLDDTGWDKLRGAFANPASWTYSDCAQGGPGEKVIFSKQMPSGRSDLFMINPDGSGGPQQLTDEAKNGHHSWRPSIFPDGKRILFERDNNLWVLNTDTHAAVSLTTDGQLGSWGYSSPSLSPDGTKSRSRTDC